MAITILIIVGVVVNIFLGTLRKLSPSTKRAHWEPKKALRWGMNQGSACHVSEESSFASDYVFNMVLKRVAKDHAESC